MNIYPYVYRIDHPSGEFYIGSRSANIVPAEADFVYKYKTSSKHLSYPFEEYTQTILAEFYLPSGKDDAYDFEQLTIFEHWGDPLLVNKRCHYGKVRWSTAGKSHSAESKKKISEANYGKKLSNETRQKMSVAKQDAPVKKHSDEAKAKMSAAKQGKSRNAETRAKISAAKKDKPRSEETRAKISAGRTGKIHSAETRAKISASWERRRASALLSTAIFE